MKAHMKQENEELLLVNDATCAETTNDDIFASVPLPINDRSRSVLKQVNISMLNEILSIHFSKSKKNKKKQRRNNRDNASSDDETDTIKQQLQDELAPTTAEQTDEQAENIDQSSSTATKNTKAHATPTADEVC
jgi:hypothetical protein